MKLFAPNHFRPSRPAALTILEMLVSTAMLSLIILGLTAVFIQVQRAFKSGIKQATITDAGRTITDMIATDLRQMSDGQTTNVVNFYCYLVSSNQVWQTNAMSTTPNQFLRTNQLDEVFILQHTNNVWIGVGYAVSNIALDVGTLYRYYVTTNGPVATNALYLGFHNSLINQQFSGTNWHRLAEGVVHFKVRALDSFGNVNWAESDIDSYGTSDLGVSSFTYPGPFLTNNGTGYGYNYSTNNNPLPSAVELELGILEPETLGKIEALPPVVQGSWITNQAVANEEIFRERISVPAVVR